eukprot:CAMPEP_0116033984 /NCGR_PEP_ID=MMETSP0321-20121206/19320_1 /TAXON_ID=163516 /ORGANISM="Leptocylindrus danicus var. danicus, Strain B650" /LENGTH=731 /DNA_ID=CAMNT_0003510175 /DNA_START=560 /DNA_END=2752 /DNA_ORIENTATION=+
MNGGDPCDTIAPWSNVICNLLETPNTILYLNLKENNLSGTIPSEVALLTDLRGLELDSNHLTGTIPSEVGLLSSLQVLILDSNSLEGAIPSELGMLEKAWFVKLNENSFSGTFPDVLGDLSSLLYLYLNENEITGTIVCESVTSQVMGIFADCAGNFPEVLCDCCDGCSRPSSIPTNTPSAAPSPLPTSQPTLVPSYSPSSMPSTQPTATGSVEPSYAPTTFPSESPSTHPTFTPSVVPSKAPSYQPTTTESGEPSYPPTNFPSESPSTIPTYTPTVTLSTSPTVVPTESPSTIPSHVPSGSPTVIPYITTVVNITYTRESNSTDDTTTAGIQEVVSSDDEDLFAFFGNSYGSSSCADESCRRLQRSARGTNNEPFRVTSVSSTVDDTKTCESERAENECHYVVTSVSTIHNLSLFPVDFVILMVTSDTLSYMDKRMIAIAATPPEKVRSLTTFIFSGVQNEEMTQNEVDLFLNSTSEFLQQSLAQTTPPMLVNEVVFDSQVIYQEGDEILEARNSLRSNVTAGVNNDRPSELAVNVTISAEYLPPPEVDFSLTVVEVFDEEGAEEYLHDLEKSGNEYFQSTPENIIDVSVVSVLVEIEPVSNMAVKGDRDDSDSTEALGMHALIAIIAASFFVVLVAALLLWKKHKNRKRSEELTQNIRFSHQSIRNLMAESQRRLELETRRSMSTIRQASGSLSDEGVSGNESSSRHIHESSMRQITGGQNYVRPNPPE